MGVLVVVRRPPAAVGRLPGHQPQGSRARPRHRTRGAEHLQPARVPQRRPRLGHLDHGPRRDRDLVALLQRGRVRIAPRRQACRLPPGDGEAHTTVPGRRSLYLPRPVYAPDMPIRVALGEDSLIVREGVHRLLAADPDIEMVAAVADQVSLRQVCEEQEPDVVLTDIRMPPTNTDEGIRLAAELRTSHPEIGVVILSQFSDPTYALALLEQGSDRRAYLLKERVHNRAELMAAIRAVAAGGSMIDPKVVEALVVARSRAERSPLNDLTARELEVLAEIAQGKSNTAIAE